jgi:hypothetical protein
VKFSLPGRAPSARLDAQISNSKYRLASAIPDVFMSAIVALVRSGQYEEPQAEGSL